MTHTSVSQNSFGSQLIETAGGPLAIEFGSLDLLLQVVRTAPVLLMPVERLVVQGGIARGKQWALHVTARGVEPGRPIYYATLPAAEVELEGEDTGKLVFPYESSREEARSVLIQGQLLSNDLRDAVIQTLQLDHRVFSLLVPGRYRLPDSWVWGVRSDTGTLPIVLSKGRWTRTR